MKSFTLRETNKALLRDYDHWFPGSWGLKVVGGFKYFVFSPIFGEDSHFD